MGWSDLSPRVRARIAGAFYLATFVAGVVALASSRGRFVANLIATASYLVVTIMFYDLFKPVSRVVSAVAAVVSIVGLGVGMSSMLRLFRLGINPLPVFGIYCLLVGFLIGRSTFLPRWLGVLLACGGLGWLTFASGVLVRQLSPYNLAPGIVAEGVLTLGLLAVGVDSERWREQAGAARRNRP